MNEITPDEIMSEYGLAELEAIEITAFLGLFHGSDDEHRAWLARIVPTIKKYGWEHVKYMQLIEYLNRKAIHVLVERFL